MPDSKKISAATVSEEMLQELRERLSELEAENAHLRQLEATIHRNARLVQALLEKSREGFVLVTPDMTILRSMHSVLGNTDEDLIGRSVLSKVHPGDHGVVQDAFARLSRNPASSVTFECRGGDKEGHWSWMEVEITDMLDDPDVQAIVLNNRDITRRKKCEETVQDLESRRCCGCLGRK